MIIGQILSFLHSDPGNKLATQVMDFFKDWKDQALKREKHSEIWKHASQLITLALVLVVATYASFNGKMDPVLAGLLGTLAGYALGKRS